MPSSEQIVCYIIILEEIQSETEEALMKDPPPPLTVLRYFSSKPKPTHHEDLIYSIFISVNVNRAITFEWSMPQYLYKWTQSAGQMATNVTKCFPYNAGSTFRALV